MIEVDFGQPMADCVHCVYIFLVCCINSKFVAFLSDFEDLVGCYVMESDRSLLTFERISATIFRVRE